ncbi:AGAP013024-PA-like protein [Anopheles sinensis]|uniref:AGAP013024-PA-like protein n=1 Tax=Anopheles sinensis TaxID=74873 RepID=A0A084WPP5_ANOSI|nr:AGAP013024-PA-like protein [Anopheles sinensis]
MALSVADRLKVAGGVLLLLLECCFGVPMDGRPRAIIEDNQFCPTPSCLTKQEIDTLWGYPDPNFFRQCRPTQANGWELQLMPCAPPTLFSFRQQVCVLPQFWEGCTGNDGGGGDGTTINPPNTEGTQDDTDEPRDQCNVPRCTTYEEINTLWAHSSPYYFYQCNPFMGAWVPQEMPCAPGTMFSYRQQVCVIPQLWEDCTVAGPTSAPTTPEPTTPTTTTTEPTTTETTTTESNPEFPVEDRCNGPRCETYEEINTLWSHPDPQFFYQCRPYRGAWVPQEMPCAKATLFSVSKQVCVHQDLFEFECPNQRIFRS